MMQIGRRSQLVVLGAAGFLPALAASTLLRSWHTLLSLLFSVVIASLGFRWTVFLVPKLENRLVKAGLFGKDINKRGTEAGERPVPESLGLAPGVVCLGCLAVTQLMHTWRLVPHICDALGLPRCESHDDSAWLDDFPAALASIAFMLMLGFVDDVLDLPWRVKLVMPMVGALPLLAAYSGATAIGIPMPIVNYFGLSQTWLELGPLYYLYMAALVIFCTNAINILAGVNGLEVGQSYIIGAAILTFNILRLAWFPGALSEELVMRRYPDAEGAPQHDLRAGSATQYARDSSDVV
jgi:UDP-N-acetylglucosamine--dolichyl-phosphate N-acetylglucosaminephosphotransferase